MSIGTIVDRSLDAIAGALLGRSEPVPAELHYTVDSEGQWWLLWPGTSPHQQLYYFVDYNHEGGMPMLRYPGTSGVRLVRLEPGEAFRREYSNFTRVFLLEVDPPAFAQTLKGLERALELPAQLESEDPHERRQARFRRNVGEEVTSSEEARIKVPETAPS